MIGYCDRCDYPLRSAGRDVLTGEDVVVCDQCVAGSGRGAGDASHEGGLLGAAQLVLGRLDQAAPGARPLPTTDVTVASRPWGGR